MKFSVASLITSAAVAMAATPSGFQPSSTNDLFAIYGNTLVKEGSEMTQNDTQTIPKIAFSTPLIGEFAVFMVDMDVPTNTTGTTTTLLHWAITNMKSSTNATKISGKQLYPLTAASGTKPLASYIGPAPPAKTPLSHRYTILLVNHTGISTSSLASLTNATSTRLSFDTSKALVTAKLDTTVIGATYFNVTNTGDAATNNASGKNGTASSTGTFKNNTASATKSSGSSSGSAKETDSSSGSGSAKSSTGASGSSPTSAVSAGQGIQLSRTAAVTICLLTVGAGFMGL